MVSKTLQGCYSMTEPCCPHEYYEVCMDNGSQVNIVDSRLLTGLHSSCKGFRSMNGSSKTKRVGNLSVFSNMMTAPPVSSAWLMWRIYTQSHMYRGESITIHMEDRNVVFVHKDEMYVVDFSNWIVEDKDRVAEIHTDLSLMWVSSLWRSDTPPNRRPITSWWMYTWEDHSGKRFPWPKWLLQIWTS